MPALILHDDDDQIVPIGASPMLSSKLVKNAQLKVYKSDAQRYVLASKRRVQHGLLAFFQA